MTLQEILQLFGLTGGSWTAIGMVVLLWLWHACSDWSRVPLDKAWRPVAMVVVGVGYGTIQAIAGGQDVKTAVAHGLSMAVFGYGLGALVLEAAFKGKMPPWLATILGLFPQPKDPPAPPADKGAGPGAAAAVVLVALLGMSHVACISSAPTVPVTPQNSAQVASCQQTASLHNGVVIGDIVVGAGATGVGAAAAIPSIASNDSTRTGLALTSAGLAAVTTAGAGIAALTASNFANGHCSDVVAPLPLKPGPGGKAQLKPLPSFSELPEGDIL